MASYGSVIKKVPANARDLGSKSGLENPPAGGNDSPVALSGESYGQREPGELLLCGVTKSSGHKMSD